MFRRFSINFSILSMAVDAIVIAGSLWLAQLLRPVVNDVGFIKSVGDGVSIPAWLYYAFVLIWIGTFLAASVYDGRKQLRRVEELTTFSLAAMFAVIASAGVLYFFYRDLSRFLFLGYVFLALLGLGGWRGAYRLLGGRAQSYRHRRTVLIVGEGEVGELLSQHIKTNPEFGLDFVGFVGERLKKTNLGDYKQLREIVLQLEPDHVVIALPRKSAEAGNTLIKALFDIPVRVWLAPDFLSMALHEAHIEEYAGVTMLDLRAPALTNYQRMVKRGFDLLVSLMLLPIILVLMIPISLFILIFDPGPIFYVSDRAGENGKPFRMLKFRTMNVVADKMKSRAEGGYKTESDPRITPIGRILRKTSLDEIPQIFNVLRGEMSLVGPRPELPELVGKYENWQRARFTVPPGITGWWQVNGRSDRPMHLHTEDDIFYIKQYSIWLDLQILVRTIWIVIIGRGAY